MVSAAASESAEKQQPFSYQNIDTVVVLGDVHGAIKPLVTLLQGAGLIDAAQRWSGGTTHLVSLGDLIDRGDATRPVLDLMIRLQQEAAAAGGRVHVLLGNHELMNLTGDWRDVTASDLASFPAPTGEPATSARRQAFYRSGDYGDWLLQRPLMIKINDRLYTHGGLPSLLLDDTIDKANDVPMNLLKAMVVEAEALVRAGALEPDMPLLDLAERLPPAEGEDPSLQRLRRMASSPYFGDYGPLWYRGTSGCAAVIEHDLTRQVLTHFHATSVIVGHSPTWNYQVRALMGGKAWAIDTGMLHAVYGGQASALQIRGDRVVALDAQGNATTTAPEVFKPSDAQALAARAAVLRDSYSVSLAAAQPEAERPERYRSDRLVELVSADGGVHGRGWFRKLRERQVAKEIAAWRLDRLLGLGMVPDTFPATVGKDSGIVATMDSAVLTEQQRLDQERGFPNWCEHGNSYQAVTVFDALINQRNRNSYNLGYQRRLTRIRLSDHSDSFGTASKPPGTTAPTVISETLRERLQTLSHESATAALGGLLSKREIKALLKRRDIIVGWPGIAAP